jgi:hypothetical protein
MQQILQSSPSTAMTAVALISPRCIIPPPIICRTIFIVVFHCEKHPCPTGCSRIDVSTVMRECGGVHVFTLYLLSLVLFACSNFNLRWLCHFSLLLLGCMHGVRTKVGSTTSKYFFWYT